MGEDQAGEHTVAESGDVAAPERVQIRLKTSKALSEAGFGDVLVLSHESVREVFTPKRRDIIEVLAAGDISSVRDLADRLDRNPGNVSRELELLVKHNIVGYVEDGAAKRPVLEHDTVISEPLIASNEPKRVAEQEEEPRCRPRSRQRDDDVGSTLSR
jgi:predicted transcriptional regulator